MKTRNYESDHDKNTGSTETHMATDEHMKIEDANAYEEGFSSASGVRPDTASSGGRIRHPESKDHARSNMKSNHLDEEDAGLAE